MSSSIQSDGAVIPSAIKHIPIAGNDFTKFIQDLIRDREKTLPPDESFNMARRIKEQCCYVTSNLVKEFTKYDTDPTNFLKMSGCHNVTKKVSFFPIFSFSNFLHKQPFEVDVGYERFLTPEIFFNPEIYSSEYTTPLQVLVDTAIQQSPIDCRRKLYSNIVLSGGSTLFKHFGKRLEKEVRTIVDNRLQEHEKRSGVKPTPIDVKVITHAFQRNAVYFGGSMLAGTPIFQSMVRTKAQYDEYGPAICRVSPTFSSLS